MICKNCGRELAADAEFCEECGAPVAASPKKERKPLDERHQYLITVILGGLAVSIVTTLLNTIAGRFSSTVMLGASSLGIYLNIFTNVVFYTCLLLTVIGYSGGEKRRKVFSIVTSVFTLTVFAAMIFGAFTFAGRLVHGMLYGDSMTSNVFFRIFGVAALLTGALCAVLGFLIKKKLLITGIVLAALILLEAGFIFGAYFLSEIKGSAEFGPALVGITYGVLIPVVYVFPNVGAWKAGK